jgi:hypothetical protein
LWKVNAGENGKEEIGDMGMREEGIRVMWFRGLNSIFHLNLISQSCGLRILLVVGAIVDCECDFTSWFWEIGWGE